MAQAAVSDVAGQWLLAGRSEKTMAGGSSSHDALCRLEPMYTFIDVITS